MFRRTLIAVAVVAVLATACGKSPWQVSVSTGKRVSGDAGSLVLDDDKYFTVGAECNGYFGGCVTEWNALFSHDCVPTGPLSLEYIGKNAGAGFQFIFVYNYRTSSWYPIDAFRVVATSEVRVKKTLPGPNSDWFVEFGTGGRGGSAFLAGVRVATIGNLNSTSADLLLGTALPNCD